MAVITFKGASRRNNSGTGNQVKDLSFSADEMILVSVGFSGDSPPDRVLIVDTDIELLKAYQRLDSVNGFGVAVYALRRVWEDLSLVTVRTEWDVAVSWRVMSVYSVDGLYAFEQGARALNATTTEPTSGSTSEHKDRDSFAFGVLCANGPDTDVNLTPSAGWTYGDKKGTTNATATDNVTITNLYQSLTVCDPIAAAGTGATSRNWASICLVFRPIPEMATDMNGGVIFVGNTVRYNGSNYEVLSIGRNRNAIELATVGSVGATETYLVRA